MTQRNDSKAKLTLEDGIQIKMKSPNNSNRMLVTISVLLLLAAIGMLIALIIVSNRKEMNIQKLGEYIQEMEETCYTPECIKTAASVIQSMNTQVDPCEDFYEYSCGGWEKSHVIPEDLSRYSTFSVLRENLHITLKALFEKPRISSEPSSIGKVKEFYASCVDVDTIEEKDAQPLVDLLNKLGGWPVLGEQPGGNWQESDYDFENLWSSIVKYSNYILVEGYVDSNVKDSMNRILIVDQPILGMMSRDYFLDDAKYGKEKRAYLKFMKDVALLLGGNQTQVENDMNDVLAFETALANLTVPINDRRDAEAMYHLFTLRELDIDVPGINFRKYFEAIMPPGVITDDEPVVNYSPEYIRQAAKLLSRTPPRTVANYMIWLITKYLVPDLSQRFRDVIQDYDKVLLGTTVATARWRDCVESINSAMQFASGRMYVTETFSEKSKEKIQKMIIDLKNSFKDLLKSNEWMDQETKNVAGEKINSMKQHIGYPDWIMDDKVLDKKYAHYEYEADDYFTNSLKTSQYASQELFSKLREPVNKSEWITGPAIVNAYYNFGRNLIMFPAGILQPPFYHEDAPNYLNYGGIGMVIGHEITHGYDDRGRQYDKDGNLVQWWTDNSITNFKERAQCIVDQYSSYVMVENNMSLDGKQTQGENIADNGGLKEAFKAYTTAVKDMQQPPKNLPGLNLSHEQLLYVNFAQVWCSLIRPEGVTQRILTGYHSPDRFRVIGTLHNSDDFSRVFQCSADAKMNSKKKCVIW